MRGGDARASRIALVAEYLVNPDAPENALIGGSAPAVGPLLDELGFGLVVLPPFDFPAAEIDTRIEYLVDDLEEYRRNGYGIVVVGVDGLPGAGVWLDRVERELASRDATPLPTLLVPLDGDEPPDVDPVREFLAGAVAG